MEPAKQSVRYGRMAVTRGNRVLSTHSSKSWARTINRRQRSKCKVKAHGNHRHLLHCTAVVVIGLVMVIWFEVLFHLSCRWAEIFPALRCAGKLTIMKCNAVGKGNLRWKLPVVGQTKPKSSQMWIEVEGHCQKYLFLSSAQARMRKRSPGREGRGCGTINHAKWDTRPRLKNQEKFRPKLKPTWVKMEFFCLYLACELERGRILVLRPRLATCDLQK